MSDSDRGAPENGRPLPTMPRRAVIDLPGSTRADFPDGSQLVEGPAGDKYLISESGDINGTLPIIRRVEIDNLALVERHDITQVHATVSHTLHFAGGGTFCYLHHCDGAGMTIQARRMMLKMLADGVIVVCGSCPP